jgi:hypothetical protein
MTNCVTQFWVRNYIITIVICFLLGNSTASEFYMPVGVPTCLWRWNRECSETSAYKIQTPGNYPGENVQHTEHGQSLKSRTNHNWLFHQQCHFYVQWDNINRTLNMVVTKMYQLHVKCKQIKNRESRGTWMNEWLVFGFEPFRAQCN